MFGSRLAIGVDLADDAWRVVALRVAGSGYEVVAAASMPRLKDAGEDPEELAALLKAAGANHGRLAVSLPASGCAFKSTSLPPAKPAELAQVARFEAENQLPLALDELEWGYELTPEPSGRYLAAIVGARRALVDERLALLKRAGVAPALLLPAPLAAACTTSMLDGVYVIVLAGAEWSDLCIYDGGRLLGCRSVLAGSPRAAGWVERIAREVRPWIVGHEGLQQIVLLGNVTAEMATALAKATGVLASPGNPWQDVRDPQGLLQRLQEPAVAYAAAIGLARTALERKKGINLLPARLLEARSGQRKQIWAIAALVLALAVLVPPTLSGNTLLTARQQKLREVQKQVQAVRRKGAKGPGAGIMAGHQVVAALATPENRPLEILRLLSDKLPKAIVLNDMAYNRGKTVVLKGRAPSNAELAAAVTAISKLAIFERVMLNFSTQVADESGTRYDFQITCTLPASADATLGVRKNGRSAQSGQGTVVR